MPFTQRHWPPSRPPDTRLQLNPPGVVKWRLIEPRYALRSRLAALQVMLRAELIFVLGYEA
jgi:hypothetical protein